MRIGNWKLFRKIFNSYVHSILIFSFLTTLNLICNIFFIQIQTAREREKAKEMPGIWPSFNCTEICSIQCFEGISPSALYHRSSEQNIIIEKNEMANGIS